MSEPVSRRDVEDMCVCRHPKANHRPHRNHVHCHTPVENIPLEQGPLMCNCEEFRPVGSVEGAPGVNSAALSPGEGPVLARPASSTEPAPAPVAGSEDKAARWDAHGKMSAEEKYRLALARIANFEWMDHEGAKVMRDIAKEALE